MRANAILPLLAGAHDLVGTGVAVRGGTIGDADATLLADLEVLGLTLFVESKGFTVNIAPAADAVVGDGLSIDR